MLLEGEDLYALDIAQASGPIIERFTKGNTFVFSTNLPPFPTSLPTGWTQDYSDKKKEPSFCASISLPPFLLTSFGEKLQKEEGGCSLAPMRDWVTLWLSLMSSGVSLEDYHLKETRVMWSSLRLTGRME